MSFQKFIELFERVWYYNNTLGWSKDPGPHSDGQDARHFFCEELIPGDLLGVYPDETPDEFAGFFETGWFANLNNTEFILASSKEEFDKDAFVAFFSAMSAGNEGTSVPELYRRD